MKISFLLILDLLISAEVRPTPENRTTKMVLLNNLAECLLRLDRWREAEKRAAEVLEIDENDQKALWRRGKARVRLLEVYVITSPNIKFFIAESAEPYIFLGYRCKRRF